MSLFDRRWWRENDIFVLPSDINSATPKAQPYYSVSDLVRRGNGKDNFGILRTFYVAGYEQAYNLKETPIGISKLINKSSSLDVGARIYFERFIDDKLSLIHI